MQRQEGAGRSSLWHAQSWAGLAEQSCPAQPVLHCLSVLLGPGTASAERRKGEQLCTGIWLRRSTKDWCNSVVCFGCQQQHRALLRPPPRASVEPELRHIHPDCLNAHFYHMGDIHKGKGKQGSSKCISSRDNVFYHNDSHNTKSNLSAFFSDLKSNSSALSLYLIRICCKASTLKMRVKSICKNPMKFPSLSLICCSYQPFFI